jgi:hypothetical protein
MNLNEIILNYINYQHSDKERKIGRFWSSDIPKIIKGELTPENFFSKKEVPVEDAKLMIVGIGFEAMLKEIFEKTKIDFEYQVKKEYQLDDEIILVAKTDFLFKNFILETKFNFSNINRIPLKYTYQLECQSRIFGLPVYLGLFQIPFDLKIIPYFPDPKKWKKIKNILFDFNAKLKKLYPEKLLQKPEEKPKEEEKQLALSPEMIIEEANVEKEVNEIIKSFKIVNPSYTWLFKIKTQREAIKRLKEKLGEEKLLALIKFLPKYNSERYNPKISTPYQLEQKLPAVIGYLKELKQKKLEEERSRREMEELKKRTQRLLEKPIL